MKASVYVDAAVHPFRRMVMCHMFSPVLDELHAMAERIGIQRRWFQDPTAMAKVSWPHYDICKSKRVLAVEAGAIEVDRYQFLAMAGFIQRRVCGFNVDPLRALRGHAELGRVADWLQEQTGESWHG